MGIFYIPGEKWGERAGNRHMGFSSPMRHRAWCFSAVIPSSIVALTFRSRWAGLAAPVSRKQGGQVAGPISPSQLVRKPGGGAPTLHPWTLPPVGCLHSAASGNYFHLLLLFYRQFGKSELSLKCYPPPAYNEISWREAHVLLGAPWAH